MSLFDPQPNFAEHDTFLFALLGLASVNEKWTELLVANKINGHRIDEKAIAFNPSVSHREVSEANMTRSSTPKSSEVSPVASLEDDVVLALLGIFSLSNKLENLLREWAQGGEVMTEVSTPGTFGFDEIDDLLR